MASEVDKILEERGTRYGSFETHAQIAVGMKDPFYKALWQQPESLEEFDKAFPPFMQEAADMIFHKLARIANGDPFYDDSWTDIAGYAQLVVDILHKNQVKES